MPVQDCSQFGFKSANFRGGNAGNPCPILICPVLIAEEGFTGHNPGGDSESMPAGGRDEQAVRFDESFGVSDDGEHMEGLGVSVAEESFQVAGEGDAWRGGADKRPVQWFQAAVLANHAALKVAFEGSAFQEYIGQDSRFEEFEGEWSGSLGEGFVQFDHLEGRHGVRVSLRDGGVNNFSSTKRPGRTGRAGNAEGAAITTWQLEGAIGGP